MTQSIDKSAEDLCLETQCPDKKPGWCHALVFPVLAKQSLEDPWGLLVSYYGLICELHTNESLISKNEVS